MRCTQSSSSPSSRLSFMLRMWWTWPWLSPRRLRTSSLPITLRLPLRLAAPKVANSRSSPHKSGSQAVFQLTERQLSTSMPTLTQKQAAPRPVEEASQPHFWTSARVEAMCPMRCVGLSLMTSYALRTTAVRAHSLGSRSRSCWLWRSCLVAMSW